MHHDIVSFYVRSKVLFFFSRDVHDRYVRNFGGKLSSLYTLLCYIYHLRTRDLRIRVRNGNCYTLVEAFEFWLSLAFDWFVKLVLLV